MTLVSSCLHVTDLVLTSFLLTLNRFDIVESEYVNAAGFLKLRLKFKRTFFQSESQENLVSRKTYTGKPVSLKCLDISGIHTKNTRKQTCR